MVLIFAAVLAYLSCLAFLSKVCFVNENNDNFNKTKGSVSKM